MRSSGAFWRCSRRALWVALRKVQSVLLEVLECRHDVDHGGVPLSVCLAEKRLARAEKPLAYRVPNGRGVRCCMAPRLRPSKPRRNNNPGFRGAISSTVGVRKDVGEMETPRSESGTAETPKAGRCAGDALAKADCLEETLNSAERSCSDVSTNTCPETGRRQAAALRRYHWRTAIQGIIPTSRVTARPACARRLLCWTKSGPLTQPLVRS